jgi:hypothetical protein
MADPLHLVVAECPACGERRFRATREAPEPGDVLTCESCGLKLSYAFLQARSEPAPAPQPAPRPKRKKAAARGARKRKRRTSS